MDPLSETKKSYGLTAAEYAQKVAHLNQENTYRRFMELLPNREKILDMGCGSGRDALFFCTQGFKVVGIDFSPQMIDICRQTVPSAEFHVMAIEEIDFSPGSFSGVWANASLLHLPKNRISIVLAKICALLQENGLFYLSLKEGSGEIYEEDVRYGGVKKFWAFYQEKEIAHLLTQAGFHILSISTIAPRSSYDTHPFLSLFVRKP